MVIATLFSSFWQHYTLFSWTDLLEIFIVSSIIYGVSRWLASDTHHNLLPHFYTYLAAQILAYTLPLPTLSFLLLATAPMVATLFIIMHQHQLQRNFITCTRLRPEAQKRELWIEALVQAALTSINNNRTFYCIIEHRLALEPLVHAPLLLHARFDKQLLQILMESSSFTPERMIWLNTDGEIVAINASWRTQPDAVWLTAGTHEMPLWQQQGLFFSKKSDAIIVRITPEERTFNVIIKGALIDNLNAHTTMTLIKEAIKTVPTPSAAGNAHEKISSGKQANS